MIQVKISVIVPPNILATILEMKLNMHIHFMVVKKSVKKESKQAGDCKTSNVSHKTQNPVNSSSNKL